MLYWRGVFGKFEPALRCTMGHEHTHDHFVATQIVLICVDLIFSFFVLYSFVVTFGGFIHKTKMYYTFTALMMISNNVRSISALLYAFEIDQFQLDKEAFHAVYPKPVPPESGSNYSVYLTRQNEVYKSTLVCTLHGAIRVNAVMIRNLCAVLFLFEIASVFRIFDFQKWYCMCCGSWSRTNVRRKCYTKFVILFVVGYGLILGLIWGYGRSSAKCGLHGYNNGVDKYTTEQTIAVEGMIVLAYVILLVLSFNIFFFSKQKLLRAGVSKRKLRSFGLKFSFFLVLSLLLADLNQFTYVIAFLRTSSFRREFKHFLTYMACLPATYNGLYLMRLSKELRESMYIFFEKLICRLCCCSATPYQEDKSKILPSALSATVLSSSARSHSSSDVELSPSLGEEGSSLKQSLLQHSEDGSLKNYP